MRPVRPDTVRDDRAVPGPRIYDGHDRYHAQHNKEASLKAVTTNEQNEHQRNDQEEQQELSVSHRDTGVPVDSWHLRWVIAYQHGVVAAVVAAVTASLTAAIFAWPTPLESTAETLMKWTPLPVADFLLAHVSEVARPAAIMGALAIFMLFGGLAALLPASLPKSATGKIVGLALAGIFLWSVMVIILDPGTKEPVLWLIGSYLLALLLATRSKREVSNRREFIERTGIILGGAAVLVSLLSIEPLLHAAANKRLFPFRRRTGLRVEGITDLVTPRGQFYIMDAVLQYPELGPPNWQLTMDGAVERPAAFDYESLQRLPRVNRYITMECVDNPVGGRLISNALWTGVPIRHLLDVVGARGDTVVFHGADTYPESTSMRELIDRSAIIAYGMNGESLPREHGYPARLVLPGIYGFKSVKWLIRLEVVHGPQPGAWHSHGWTDTAVIHAGTRIDVAERVGGLVTLAGIAFAGNRGVAAVEVRANRGPWHRASLGTALSHETWTQWVIRWRGAGPATFEVRTIDGHGTVQTSWRRPPYPDGSSGWSRVTV